MHGISKIQTNAWPRVILRRRYGTLATRIETTNKVIAPRNSHGTMSPGTGLVRDRAMSDRYRNIGYNQSGKKYRQCNRHTTHNSFVLIDCFPSMLLESKLSVANRPVAAVASGCFRVSQSPTVLLSEFLWR
jgi:hypothetical protein